MAQILDDQITQCPQCESSNLRYLTGLEEVTNHYGRLVCGDCNRFIKWLQNPALTVLAATRKQIIEMLIFKGAFLPQSDRQFLKDISDVRWLRIKQEIYLSGIYKKVHGVVMPDSLWQYSIKSPSKAAEGL